MGPPPAVYIVAEVLIGVLTILGNLTILVAFSLNKNLQKLKFATMISLALADFAYGVAIPPAAVLSYLGLPTYFRGCLFVNSMLAMFAAISVFNMMAITFERFLAIRYPFDYYRKSPADDKTRRIRTFLFITIAWCTGMLVGLVPVMGWNLGPTPDGKVCSFVDVIDFAYYVYVYAVTCWLIPLIIMCIVYSYVFATVKRKTRSSVMCSSGAQGQLEMKKLKKENYVAKTFFILCVCFIICKLPLHVIDTYQLIHGSVDQKGTILLITLLFNHFNSTVNPAVYAYRNKAIRIALKTMFRKVANSCFSICRPCGVRIDIQTDIGGSTENVIEST